jgi:4-amino-4-deoxy-L-arabinose transferase-like glycosyltransferase
LYDSIVAGLLASPMPALDASTTNRAARFTFLIFALGFAIFSIAGLRRDLWAPDEPRHAEVAAEMLRTGDYVVPHLSGDVYPDKPPPPFWVMTVTLRIFGEQSEWAARLPYALAAGLLLALTFALARRLFDDEIALTATLLLATAAQFMWLAQRVSLDIFQTLFVVSAIFAWVREQRGEGSSLTNGFLFFTACGLGLSTKGPTALLVPLAAAIGHAIATGSLAKLRAPRFLVSIVVMLGIVAAWLIPATLEAGEEYARAILGSRSFGRFTTAQNHDRPWWYYFKEWPVEFLPWSPAFLTALWVVFRSRLLEPGPRHLLAAWIGVPFIVLSISITKRGNYLMPLYPAAAILTAAFIHHLERMPPGDALDGARLGLLRVMKTIVGILAIAGIAAIVAPHTPWVTVFAIPGAGAAGFVAGAALLTLALAALRRSGASVLVLHRKLAGGLLALIPLVGLAVFPVIDHVKSDRLIAEKLLATVGETSAKPIAFVGHAPEASRFYSHLDCVELDGRDELAAGFRSGVYDYAVIDRKRWNKFIVENPEFAFLVTEHEIGSGRAATLVLVELK